MYQDCMLKHITSPSPWRTYQEKNKSLVRKSDIDVPDKAMQLIERGSIDLTWKGNAAILGSTAILSRQVVRTSSARQI